MGPGHQHRIVGPLGMGERLLQGPLGLSGAAELLMTHTRGQQKGAPGFRVRNPLQLLQARFEETKRFAPASPSILHHPAPAEGGRSTRGVPHLPARCQDPIEVIRGLIERPHAQEGPSHTHLRTQPLVRVRRHVHGETEEPGGFPVRLESQSPLSGQQQMPGPGQATPAHVATQSHMGRQCGHPPRVLGDLRLQCPSKSGMEISTLGRRKTVIPGLQKEGMGELRGGIPTAPALAGLHQDPRRQQLPQSRRKGLLLQL